MIFLCGAETMSEQWYALRSKPNKEDALSAEATARGLDVFYPRIRVQPVNPRARTMKPYFPGYLFVRYDLEAQGFSALAWIPYSRGPVCCDGQPSPVPEPIVAALRRRLEQVNQEGGESSEGLKKGDPLIVQGGPFDGLEAIFDAKASGAERVRVLLKLLGGTQVSAVLPAAYVRRKRVR